MMNISNTYNKIRDSSEWLCFQYAWMAFIEIYDIHTRYEECAIDVLCKFIRKLMDICVASLLKFTRNMWQVEFNASKHKKQIFPFKFHVLPAGRITRTEQMIYTVFKLRRFHQSPKIVCLSMSTQIYFKLVVLIYYNAKICFDIGDHLYVCVQCVCVFAFSQINLVVHRYILFIVKLFKYPRGYSIILT